MHLRPLPALLVVLLAAATLAGCKTNSQVCKDGVCTISLSGEGATTTLGTGDDGDEVELISATDTTAQLRLGQEEFELTEGQVVELLNGELQIEEVKENKVKLKLVITEAPADDAAQ